MLIYDGWTLVEMPDRIERGCLLQELIYTCRLYLLIEGARWFPLRFDSDLSLGGIDGSTSIYAPWACYIWLLSTISAAAGIIPSIPPWGNSVLSSSYLLISSSFFKFSSVTSKHYICHN